METVNAAKACIIAIGSAIASFFGELYIPFLLLVICNVIDYGTGIAAAPYRKQEIKSYKGMKGIIKKVCMWVLVAVGAVIDTMLKNGLASFGMKDVKFNLAVSCILCIWLICNELLSILENMIDIGVPLPPFLQPLIQKITHTIESSAEGNFNVPESKENK